MADLSRRRVERRSASLASMAALMSPLRRSWRAMKLFLRFERAQGVADLGRLFVVLAFERFAERALQFFAGRERTLGADFREPGFERLDFAALLDHFGPCIFPVEIADVLESLLDLAD